MPFLGLYQKRGHICYVGLLIYKWTISIKNTILYVQLKCIYTLDMCSTEQIPVYTFMLAAYVNTTIKIYSLINNFDIQH